MTTNTNDEAAFRQALLTSPGELQGVEYKSAVPFNDDTEFGLKLIKHILGMANTGGGWIVIGYKDDNLQPDARHSIEIAATYDTTRLSDTANRYVERGQSLKLSVYMEVHPQTQISHPIIRVEEFERVPLICRSTKSASNANEPVLQSGKVYIRRPGAATSEIRTPYDWDELLKLCVSKRRDEFLQEFADLFRRLSSGDSKPQEDPNVAFNTWIEDQRKISPMPNWLRSQDAHIEVAHKLVLSRATEWTYQALIDVAMSARNFYGQDLKPRQDGIEARSGPEYGIPNYWYLDKSGACPIDPLPAGLAKQ